MTPTTLTLFGAGWLACSILSIGFFSVSKMTWTGSQKIAVSLLSLLAGPVIIAVLVLVFGSGLAVGLLQLVFRRVRPAKW